MIQNSTLSNPVSCLFPFRSGTNWWSNRGRSKTNYRSLRPRPPAMCTSLHGTDRFWTGTLQTWSLQMQHPSATSPSSTGTKMMTLSSPAVISQVSLGHAVVIIFFYAAALSLVLDSRCKLYKSVVCIL